MAGVKISNLPAIAAPALSDEFAVVQAGVTYKETITQLGTLVLLLSGGTMTGNLILNGDPSANLQAATKQYVDAVATGLHVQAPCVSGSVSALTVSYNNGASGVGATLTNAGAMAAFALDGTSPTAGQRVLIKDQAAALQNGIYTVTDVGSGATNWVLTRATDFDTPSEIQPGDYVLVLNGTVNASTSWVQTATVAAVGVDSINWNQFSSDVNALITSIQNNAYNYVVDTGAADAYVATLSPAVTSYVAGLIVYLEIANVNTGASTLNVNGLGVKDIKTTSGGDPLAGDLAVGEIAILQYDGTNFQMINIPYNRMAKSAANADITSMTGLTGKLRAPTAIASSADVNVLSFTYTASAVNYIDVTNSITTTSPILTAVGTDADIGIQFQMKGAGFYHFLGSASAPAFLNIAEQTTNGTNYIQIAVPNAISATRSLTLQEPPANAYITYDSTSTAAWTSWTPGWGGFVVDPTVDAYYKKIGNTCFIMINATAPGTSNATSFTITTLPFSAVRTVYVPVAFAQDNGVTISTSQASISGTTITLYVAGNGAGWTNAGNKYANFSFAYETS